jgi:predicted nucleotide-binding protein (sugar kinase/HSP70/actin superfamily)
MKITFPHLGNTYITVKSIFDDLGLDYVIPPFNNKKALELGTKFVSEMACLPLKINIGNYIQAYEMGADTILMAGGCGPCRFGYYSQMHREILRDAGYDVEIITLEFVKDNISELANKVCRLSGKAGLLKVPIIVMQTVKIAKRVDELELQTFKIRAREQAKGSVDEIYRNFRMNVLKAYGYKVYQHFWMKQTKSSAVQK